MKLGGVSNGAMPPASELANASPRVQPTAVEGILQYVRQNSRWRRVTLGTLLLVGCAYAALVVGSSYDCSLNTVTSYNSGDSQSAYCMLAGWSRSMSPARQNLPLYNPGAASTPYRNTTSIDRIVFGIGVNEGSWSQRREYIKLWWKPGVTRGFVWADQSLDPWDTKNDPPFKVSEDATRFGYTHPMHTTSAVRISRIVVEMYRLQLPNVDWFVMGDDDTLFFPENLVHVLSKYDATKFHYIGCNSEDSRQSERHHYGLAFGGGGFAISLPLAKALSETQDECLTRYTELYGSDERIKACVSELGVPLTKEVGFHQLDVHGDITGLLAALPVAPVVSLHHLEEIEPIFYGITQLEAAKRLMKAVEVSSSGLFQQSICYDEGRNWSFSVAWGYGVEVYEGFLRPRELEVPASTFMSWAWRREFNAFTMDTRELPDFCTRPTRFFMVDAWRAKRKRMGVSTYEKLVEFQDKGCKAKPAPFDSVEAVKVVREEVSEDWFENPRRQCCSIKRMDSRGVEIRIRACVEALHKPWVFGRRHSSALENVSKKLKWRGSSFSNEGLART